MTVVQNHHSVLVSMREAGRWRASGRVALTLWLTGVDTSLTGIFSGLSPAISLVPTPGLTKGSDLGTPCDAAH